MGRTANRDGISNILPTPEESEESKGKKKSVSWFGGIYL